MKALICQVVNRTDARLTCPVTESGGYQCEVQGPHDKHRIGEHTIQHALAGNGYACSAIGVNTCVTCDLPEDRWDPTDPLYICGGVKCPDCTRVDHHAEKLLDHAEATR